MVISRLWVESTNLAPSFAWQLEIRNPGSVAPEDVTTQCHLFLRIFYLLWTPKITDVDHRFELLTKRIDPVDISK